MSNLTNRKKMRQPKLFTNPVTILILDNNSPFVLPLVRSFSGYTKVKLDVLLATDQEPNNFIYSRYIRKIYREVPLTEENFEGIITKYIKKSSADTIITTRESISKLIYQHRHTLGKIVKIPPVSDAKTLDTLYNKWELNRWLMENSFPYSMALPYSKELKTSDIINAFSFPILLKPLSGTGGTGIKLVNNTGDLISALSSDVINSDKYFIQEYIEGYDIDISFFAVDGKILFYTIQKGIITGYLTYSKGIDFVRNKELFDLTSEIVSKLGFSGIAHLDFRYDNKKKTYVLIDFNSRYWSSMDGSRIRGVNFPVLGVAYSLGIQFTYPQYSSGTYYFANAARRTFLKNLFSKKKTPIKLHQTELRYLLIDPVPEMAQRFKRFTLLISNWIGRKGRIGKTISQ